MRRYRADTIVSVETSGGIARSSWGEVERHARQLASALEGWVYEPAIAVPPSPGTISAIWKSTLASPATKLTHTINPRLAPEQLVYIINHAETDLFRIKPFLPVAAKLGAHLKNRTPHCVAGRACSEEAASMVPSLLFYDELLAKGHPDNMADAGQTAPSSLCYTSGTAYIPRACSIRIAPPCCIPLRAITRMGLPFPRRTQCCRSCHVPCFRLGCALYCRCHGLQAGVAGAGTGW
ncbi:MAG: hypothetical protein R3E89_18675 [Thiolinea sp.]